MRTAALPTFRKLWRVINTPLRGTYTVEIKNSALLLIVVF